VVDGKALELAESWTEPLLSLFPMSENDSFVRHGRRLSRLHHPRGKAFATSELVVPALAAWQGDSCVLAITAETEPRLLTCKIGSSGAVATEDGGKLPSALHEGRILRGGMLIGYPNEEGAVRLGVSGGPHTALVAPGPGELTVGVHFASGKPALIVIDETQSSLSWIHADGARKTFFTTTEGIRHVQTSPYGPQIAMLTASGSLVVRSLSGETLP
jgi:hypothetical protein